MIKNMAELVMNIDLCDKDIQSLKNRIRLNNDSEFWDESFEELTKALNG